MAFRDLFKKKAGGRFLGNIIRNVGDKFTGGMMSSVFPVPTASDVAKQEAKWTAKGKEFKPDQALKAIDRQLGTGGTKTTTRGAQKDKPEDDKDEKSKVGLYVGIGAGVLALGTGIVLAVKSGKNNKSGGRGRR